MLVPGLLMVYLTRETLRSVSFPTCYCKLETLAIFRFLINSSWRKSGVSIKISYQKEY